MLTSSPPFASSYARGHERRIDLGATHVTQVARPAGPARAWDRFVASDPGLLRLMAGLRTVTAIGLALAVLGLAGTDVTHMVAGAMAAMVATFAIREKTVRGQAVTLTFGLPVALTAMALGALLHSRVVA